MWRLSKIGIFYLIIHISEVTPSSVLLESEARKFNILTDPIQRGLQQLGIKQDSGYNIHLPPPVETGQPVEVQISISLRNILDIDEVRQLITVETTLRLYWKDSRLKVEHLLQERDDYILMHPDTVKYIWCPDIYIDFAKALRSPKFLVAPASLRIYRNSTLRYASQINYDVACPMSFQRYPHDTQICKVKFESYGHTSDKMDVRWKRGLDASKITDNNSISLAQFDYAVSFEEEYREAIASGEYPGVIMTIALRRKLSYHLLQTFLPSALFVIVAWLSLFLPPESIPGRIAMAMTTLLTLAAMFGAVRQNTPRVSYVTALDVWMCACIVFVFLTLLEYVIVLCIIHKKKERDETQLGNTECGSVRIEEALKENSNNSREIESGKKVTRRISRKPGYSTEDCVEINSRIIIALVFLLFNCVYWIGLVWVDDLQEELSNNAFNILSNID